MNVTKKKLSYGLYEVLSNGVRVALISKLVDSSEPIWELAAIDGTNTAFPNGKPRQNFVTLSDAVNWYARCAKQAAAA